MKFNAAEPWRFSMKKMMVLALVVFASCAFAQDKLGQPGKNGMVWYYFHKASNCNVQWDTAIQARTEAFEALGKVVEGGDPAKVRVYMGLANISQNEVDSAWACGYDHSRNLAKYAEVALNNTQGFSTNGKMNETEYREAMTLVTTLRTKIKDQPLPEAQVTLWKRAMDLIGVKADDAYYSGIFNVLRVSTN
jgi:hypothetical protein